MTLSGESAGAASVSYLMSRNIQSVSFKMSRILSREVQKDRKRCPKEIT